MNLLVFGASGGTGRQIVEQALAQGHVVTAFVRDLAKFDLRHSNLRLVKGDVLDGAAVARAMPGHDAVLSALGAPATKTGTLRSEGTRNIVQAMEKAGIRRFVCQTSLGYGDTRPVLARASPLFRWIIAPLMLRKLFADHAVQEEIIKQSGLDWVIVRPGNLTDGGRTGAYRHGFAATDPAIKVEVSRADVADFMLKQVSDDTYLRATPGISY
jgi:putative NADH-flavin reductase